MNVQFFISGALIYLLSQFVPPALTAGKAYLFGPSLCDSLGFAFLTLTNTVLQYFLASLLAHDLKDGSELFAILTLSAVLSTALFVRLSAHSALVPTCSPPCRCLLLPVGRRDRPASRKTTLPPLKIRLFKSTNSIPRGRALY